MLDRSPQDAMKDIDKRSLFWSMFMSSTLEASVIHGKELLKQFPFHQNTGENLTLKQMFEISEQLILEQSDDIFWSVSNRLGRFSVGNSYPWSMMRKLSVSRMQKFTYFQILCYDLER